MARTKRIVKPLDTIWECPDDLWDNVIVPVIAALDGLDEPTNRFSEVARHARSLPTSIAEKNLTPGLPFSAASRTKIRLPNLV